MPALGWLLWCLVTPLAFGAGFVLGALLATAKRADVWMEEAKRDA